MLRPCLSVGCLGVLLIITQTTFGCELEFSVVKGYVKKPIGVITGMAFQYGALPAVRILRFILHSTPTQNQSSAFPNQQDAGESCFWPKPGALHLHLLQISFGLGYLMRLEPELAFGLLAIGCSPGGGGSNIITALMDGDINLSIVMTFMSNIVALGETDTFDLPLQAVLGFHNLYGFINSILNFFQNFAHDIRLENETHSFQQVQCLCGSTQPVPRSWEIRPESPFCR